MIWEIVVYSPPPAVPSRSYIIVRTRDSSSTPWFIRRPNPVFLKDIPVRRFFQRLFKSDNVMFYTSYSFDFVKSILWPKYNYLITLTGVLYKLNFALKVSSNFLFQKKWNFSTLVTFQVRLLSRETTGSALFSGGVPKPMQFLKSVLSCTGKYDIGSTIKYSILESMTDSKKLVLNSTKCMLTK